ncbi:hypothetical protein CHCC20327_2406 [Bacillus licheniformis]|nr:hypothetical protein CHCC20327_2406 [Bacillus licheniformis]
MTGICFITCVKPPRCLKLVIIIKEKPLSPASSSRQEPEKKLKQPEKKGLFETSPRIR